jgi:hypothetical protein
MPELELVQVDVHAAHAAQHASEQRGWCVTSCARITTELPITNVAYEWRPARDRRPTGRCDAVVDPGDRRRITPSFRWRPARDIAITLSQDSSIFSTNSAGFGSEAWS